MQKEDIKKIKSGGYWTALGAFAGVLSQLLIMLSLAMLLSPSDVGLFSIFLFVLGLGLTVLPFGNDFAFVQADHLTRTDLGRTIGLAILFALVVSVGIFPALSFIDESKNVISTTIAFGAIVGCLEACFALCSAALQRKLNYRAIEKANIVRQFGTLILSLSLLAFSHRVEGAFIGRLVSNVIALAMVARPMLSSLDSGASTQPFFSKISRDMLLKNVLGHISRNAEILAASPQLGVKGLGIYDLGRRIIAQPRDLIGSILFKFTYPMFSKISKIEKSDVKIRFMRLVYKNVIKITSFIGFPVFAAALLLANPLITDVFGPEWINAIYVVEIFALTAFIQVLGNNIITAALTAFGGSGVVLKAEYVTLLPRLALVYVASFYGPVLVAAAMSLFIIGKLVWMQWELNRLGDLSFGLVMKSARSSAYATGSGFLVALPIHLMLLSSLSAIISCLVFGIVYLGVFYLIEPKARNMSVRLLARAGLRRPAGGKR